MSKGGSKIEQLFRGTHSQIQLSTEKPGVPTVTLARAYGYLGIATSGVRRFSYLSEIFVARAKRLSELLNMDDDFLLSGLLGVSKCV